MKRRLVLVGAATLVAGVLVPLPARTAHAGGDWSAHNAMVQELRQRGYLVGDLNRYRALKEAAIAAASGFHGASAPSSLSPAAPVPQPSPSVAGASNPQNDLSPSDSTGAIGPTSFIEAINIQFEIFSRSGAKVALAPAEKLTGTKHLDLSDPQILWDKITNRFYYLFLDVTDDTFRWGFSKSASPTTISSKDWCSYKADFGYGKSLPDYPKMGQTAHTLVIGANIYSNPVTYLGSDIDTIQKPSGTGTITTCPAGPFKQSQTKALRNADGTPFASDPNPGQQAESPTTQWVAAVPDATNSGAVGNYIDLFAVSENGDGTDKVSKATAITVANYSPPAPAPQKGTNALLDTLDGRLTHAVTNIDPSIPGGNHGALWTSHTVAGGAGAQVAWYEIDLLAKKLKQQGTISDSSLFVLNGAVSDDRAVDAGKFGGNMVAGVTTTSANTFPADQEVVKPGSGPQSGFVMVHQSPGADDGFDCFVDPGRVVCRWGDYSGALPDPIATTGAKVGRVWMAQMDSVGGGPNPLASEWGTWIWAGQP